MSIHRVLFLLIFIVSGLCSFSQSFNNNWINYGQQYYKFKVSETGIYRIDSVLLANAGVPVSSLDPRNIQIFARGVELPIYIEGENDGVFNDVDFIEFYGQRNDGWFDEELYGGPANHPNPYYSLYNDTINYFITWNSSILNNRRTLETDKNFGAYTPISFFHKENLQVYSSGSKLSRDPYYDGKTQNIGSFAVTMFGFSATEGWFDNPYTLGGNSVKSVASKNIAFSGSNATLETVVIGWSDFSGISNGDHHLRISLGATSFDSIFEGHQNINVKMSIPLNDLGSANTSVNFASINDLGSSVDKQTIAYLKLKYAHNMDLEGATTFDKVFLDDNISESKSLFNFSNFIAAGNILFYDLTNNRRIPVVSIGSNYQCLVPNSGSQKECFISSEGQVKSVASIVPINGTGFFTNYGATPLDTAFLIITHPSLIAGANDYANYRRNPGNSDIQAQNAIVCNVEELYDQFAYGIEKHELAIRSFADYLINTWPTKPNYLFLLGKSIKSKLNRRNTVNFHNNLVPSFGVPASDNLITSGLDGTFYEPAIPTGRLSAKNNTEVNWYLNKVQEHENPEAINGTNHSDWTKRILHFGGGGNSLEQQGFKNNLNGIKNIVEDTLFGADVISYFKNTTAPVQNSISDSIKDFIEDGVALMTFLGHASTTGGFDQNIDDPALWPNQNGKYPLLIGLSCFAGDIHTSTYISSSEEHVLLDKKGVIGFLSAVDLSLANILNLYSSAFYKNMSYVKYGESIGRHIKNTITEIQQTNAGIENFSNSASLNITFHGDPSIKLNTYELPDYMIDASSVTFNPTIVTSDDDFFDVNVLISNLGKAINDTIILELVRGFSDPSFKDTTYVKFFPGTNYKEVVSFKLPVDIVKGLGLNTFKITVDPVNSVMESFENNNTVSLNLNISSGELVPIYPYDFMIVPDQGVTLKASTAFPFEPTRNYVLEVDTTDYFDSPLKESIIMSQQGGVVSWLPSLLTSMIDSTVYFWRVSKDSVDGTGFSWRKRSFQYIENKEGWGQAHFFQFENDGFQFVDHNRPIRQFSFVDDVKQLRVETHGKAERDLYNRIRYSLDQTVMGKNGYLTNASIHVAILDSATLEPWNASNMNVGHANNSPSLNNSGSENYFIFRHSASGMASLENFLKDTVPRGNHIIMWTWYIGGVGGFSEPIPLSLRAELGVLGATNSLQNVTDKYPFIFYSQKGGTSSALEVVGDSIDQKNLNLTTDLRASADYANIFSQLLGPATSWDSLSWRMTSLDVPTTKDSAILNVIGVDANGKETALINNLSTDSGDVRITNRVDASVYPYLKLSAFLSDDSLASAPQLNRWQVIYAGAPEAALDPNITFSFEKDTVEEGMDISMSIAVKNISRYDMDSLLISFSVFDKYNKIHVLPYKRYKPLLSDSVLIATLTFSSVGFSGLNSLFVDVNPNNDQLEMYHFNNVAQIPFYVKSDNINPLLDVTFDGIHILDGDIVSPKSNIVIELTDENQFLLLNDTADYALYITKPSGVEERIHFISGGAQRMQFIPASLPRNNSKIIFQGDFVEDGEYKLRVQANDRAKNNSGNFDYIIGFEIINKSTITNIINYPNPFTTSTRFVFTLTGSEIPDVFKIQIMTITGKVVREINKDELGSINIGKNISDFSWDGTDTYGDRLANGLYLFRVITQINNDEIELRKTNVDSYFKKGFGKMYLFR